MIKTASEWLNTGVKGHQELVEYYNVHCLPLIDPKRKYKMAMADNWCAMFTTCIAHMCGVGVSNFPYEVSVRLQVETCKRRGWLVSEPSENCLAFFDWKGNGTFAHVGFVHSVRDGVVTTVEGNHRGDVAVRHLPLSSPFFTGFARTPMQDTERGGYRK